MALVTEFKCRLEGIEGFCHGLEDLVLGHLHECRSPSPDLCVMRLIDEVSVVQPKHTSQFQAVEEYPAMGHSMRLSPSLTMRVSARMLQLRQKNCGLNVRSIMSSPDKCKRSS